MSWNVLLSWGGSITRLKHFDLGGVVELRSRDMGSISRTTS
jgi:hypothetical protein